MKVTSPRRVGPGLAQAADEIRGRACRAHNMLQISSDHTMTWLRRAKHLKSETLSLKIGAEKNMRAVMTQKHYKCSSEYRDSADFSNSQTLIIPYLLLAAIEPRRSHKYLMAALLTRVVVFVLI
jgi:hypothetical protein